MEGGNVTLNFKSGAIKAQIFEDILMGFFSSSKYA